MVQFHSSANLHALIIKICQDRSGAKSSPVFIHTFNGSQSPTSENIVWSKIYSLIPFPVDPAQCITYFPALVSYDICCFDRRAVQMFKVTECSH